MNFLPVILNEVKNLRESYSWFMICVHPCLFVVSKICSWSCPNTNHGFWNL